MNVLSLFDGISTGQLALQQSGIKIDKYYASEIEPNAISVTMRNFPNTIQLGDVNKLELSDLEDIDLLIGGSPCSSFSVAGKKAYFNDPRGELLNKFIEVKNALNPKYFFLENVKMPSHCTDYIDMALGTPHVLINSKDFSPQDRKRLYWTNIPIKPYDTNHQVVKDILERDVKGYTSTFSAPLTRLPTGKRKIGYYGTNAQANRVYDVNYKGVCLCGEGGGGGAKTGLYEIDDTIRKLTPIEAERMQTLPDNFTSGLTDNQRWRTLGNGWTCSVVSHIFSGITCK